VDYMNLQSSHMHEVREALELGAVQRAAKAATAEDIEKLRNALHEAAIATDAEDMLHRPIAVHLAICRASHSDVISLLTQLVLKAIGSTYSASNLPTAMTHEVGVSHQRIVGAIIARDEGMAKRYMLQHLIMIQRWTALIGQTILKRAPADASAPRLFQIASN
jgi:DNA-binding FadR family transcriptional regulator